MPEILSVFDLFVLSSFWGGLRRALTEAMIVGVPVVATAVDGVPELVTHKETGLLSLPGEPSRLAENITWSLDHPDEAQRMKQSARNRVDPTFRAERMVKRIEALYEKLIAEKVYVEKKVLSHTVWLIVLNDIFCLSSRNLCKLIFLPNLCVPDDLDLQYFPTDSNFSPPPNFGGLILEI